MGVRGGRLRCRHGCDRHDHLRRAVPGRRRAGCRTAPRRRRPPRPQGTQDRRGPAAVLAAALSGRTGRLVTLSVPVATIRRRIRIPLRFVDGYTTTAGVYSFTGLADGLPHLALELGRPGAAGPPLVRPHSECLTGDVFGSQRCDCGPQLREAVERVAEHGGYVLYLRQEGRGIGLYDKLDAYALQDSGLDTYDANVALGHGTDERDYTGAAQMLHALDATRIRLLSNNPDKGAQLAGLGISIAEHIATGLHLAEANAGYLATKARRGGHGALAGARPRGHETPAARPASAGRGTLDTA
ncbi:MAG: GTP cyclohydrolase II [Streptosporangiales bacterium]|nr:GTP cyclohydrolase II [Streptosporangiales bacterium]MBO0892508.1 GTP cyclohydrolase II [Acidothermales bacterium]